VQTLWRQAKRRFSRLPMVRKSKLSYVVLQKGRILIRILDTSFVLFYYIDVFLLAR